MMYDNYLKHYGILGMRWGRRKKPEEKLPKQSRRQKLEEKYINSGKSEEDAKRLAKRKDITEKVLITAAGITLAAGVAYVARDKYVKEYCDKVIKKGTTFHTITNNKDRDMNVPFYAAYKNTDRIRYKGLLGERLRDNILARKNVYDISTKATEDIKIPSRKKAKETFETLYKNNSEFKRGVDDLDNLFRKSPFNSPRVSKLLSDIKNNPNDMSKKYDLFNIGLVIHPGYEPIDNSKQTFYNKLKSAGYNALQDINDSKYSGYKANRPLIAFNPSSFTKDTVKELVNKDIKVANIQTDILNNGAKYAANLGLYATSGVVGYKSINKINMYNRRKTYNKKKGIR